MVNITSWIDIIWLLFQIFALIFILMGVSLLNCNCLKKVYEKHNFFRFIVVVSYFISLFISSTFILFGIVYSIDWDDNKKGIFSFFVRTTREMLIYGLVILIFLLIFKELFKSLTKNSIYKLVINTIKITGLIVTTSLACLKVLSVISPKSEVSINFEEFALKFNFSNFGMEMLLCFALFLVLSYAIDKISFKQ